MNVKGLLDELGIEVVTEDRTNFNSCCPFHDDDYPSFSINKENGKWICRAGCGAGGVKRFLSRALGCSFEEAERRLEKYCDPLQEMLQILEAKEQRHLELMDDRLFLPPEVKLPYSYCIDYPNPSPYRDYILKRLPIETAKLFRIGWCTEGRFAGRVIIPVSMGGQWRGFLARTIDPNEKKRYLNATNVLFTNLLFNYDCTHSSDVFLCESSFDALTLYSWGITNTVATFSAKISYRQMELLINRGVKTIYLCFHNDKAGNEGIQRHLSLLRSLFNIVIVKLPADKDINEMSSTEFFGCPRILQEKDETLNKIMKSISWKLKLS